MDKIRRKAEEDGANTCIYSRVLDIYEEEMERGKTHEFDTVIFKYKGKEYQLIDTPGHQKFVRSMIEGISQQVNIAVLLISMKDNEFEAAMGAGMLREHMTLCRAIGIEYMILVANKMDLIDWDEKKCKDKIKEITKYLVKELSWSKECLFVVPISAFQGIGLIDTINIPDWYKGKSFLETLDSLPDKPKEIINDFKESNRFVCEINTYQIDNIILPGYLCIAHFNGEESEVTLEKIQGKPFLRGNDKGKSIFILPQREKLAVNLRVIFRKGTNTIASEKSSKYVKIDLYSTTQ